MCLECSPEAHPRTPEIAPDSQFIVWQPCRAYFYEIRLGASPDNEFQTMPFSRHARICFSCMPGACFWFFLEFHRKSSGWKKVLGALTRATFPTCTCERSLQNVAVANDFVQNSHSRCRILTRLPTKPMRNTHKFMLRSWNYNMPCDFIAISHLAACYSMQLYVEKTQHICTYACIC